MFELKTLSPAAIPQALAKAERYRLLNEPWQAESICLDILALEPTHQEAIVTLILAISDQFRHGGGGAEMDRARALIPLLTDEYQRLYYEGIIRERRGKALLDADYAGSGSAVYEWLVDAMNCFEHAAARRPAGNDDAILRWNTCVRLLERYPQLRAREEERELQMLE